MTADVDSDPVSGRVLRLLHSVTDRVAAASGLEEALSATLRTVCETTGWVYGEAWLPAEDGPELRCGATWHDGGPGLEDFAELARSVTFPPGDGLPGRVRESGELRWLEDVSGADGYRRAEAARTAGLAGAVGVPAETGDETVAVLVFYQREAREPDGLHVRTLSAAAAQLGLALRRKQAEDRLRLSRERFEKIFRVSPLAVSISTLDEGRFVEVNDGLVRLLGWEREEIVGRTAGELEIWVDPDDRGEVVRRLRSGDTVRSFRTRLRTRSGDVRSVLFFAELLDLRGEEYMLGMSHDLTGELDARQALAKSEEKYAGVFRANPLPMAIATLDDGRFVEVNEGFEEFFGYPVEEAVGATRAELGVWADPEELDEVREILAARGRVQGKEVRFQTADGELRDVLFFGELLELEGEDCLLGIALDITERKRLEDELETQALSDALTGLPNRTLFEDRLEHALARSRRGASGLAVLFLDLDRFKVVNDSLGHAAGDQLLSAAARRIEGCFREEDTVARWGGDEFVVLLEDLDGPADAAAAVDRLREAFEDSFHVAGTEVHASASIGIAVASEELDAPEDLLRYSDMAMFRAKGESGTSHHVFDPASDSGATDRLQLENELRDAVRREQFSLRYQPVVWLEEGEVAGAEALLRWEHPERGTVSPGEFLPVAEETGLIVDIGYWVLEEAVRTAERWELPPGHEGSFRMAVNLSPKQFRHEDLVDRVRDLLDETGYPPERLVLEVTESTAVQNPEPMSRLRDLGVYLSVDDLGTGYASLEYLTRLEVDALKIDRMFIAGLGEDSPDEAIVKAILLLARDLDLPVIAEGIETDEQLQALRAMGCGAGQGYLFARPLTADDFQAYLSASPAGG